MSGAVTQRLRTSPDPRARDRRSAGITAPAKGLTLWQMYTVGQEEEATAQRAQLPGAPWRVSP